MSLLISTSSLTFTNVGNYVEQAQLELSLVLSLQCDGLFRGRANKGQGSVSRLLVCIISQDDCHCQVIKDKA